MTPEELDAIKAYTTKTHTVGMVGLSEMYPECSCGESPLCPDRAYLLALVAEIERLRAELEIAFGPSMYFDIQKVLDAALGTEQVDGAGAGIVADVALLAERKRAAEAERDRFRRELDAIHARAHDRSEELIRARDKVTPGDSKGLRGRFEFAAQELRTVAGMAAEAVEQ